MQSVMINDLSTSKELNQQALRQTSGGFSRFRGLGNVSGRGLGLVRRVSGFLGPGRGSSFIFGPGSNLGNVGFGSNNTFQGAITGINNGIQVFNFNFG